MKSLKQQLIFLTVSLIILAQIPICVTRESNGNALRPNCVAEQSVTHSDVGSRGVAAIA